MADEVFHNRGNKDIWVEETKAMRDQVQVKVQHVVVESDDPNFRQKSSLTVPLHQQAAEYLKLPLFDYAKEYAENQSMSLISVCEEKGFFFYAFADHLIVLERQHMHMFFQHV